MALTDFSRYGQPGAGGEYSFFGGRRVPAGLENVVAGVSYPSARSPLDTFAALAAPEGTPSNPALGLSLGVGGLALSKGLGAAFPKSGSEIPAAGAEGGFQWMSPSSWSWGGLGDKVTSGLGDGLASAGFGLAGSLAAGDTNTGGQVGQTIGSALGSLLGPSGALFGSMAGTAIGEQFGPPPTVGPNGNVNFRVGPEGYLQVGSAGGDNGFNSTQLQQQAASSAARLNSLLGSYGGSLKPVDPTQTPFGIGGGTDGSDMTLQVGDWMAPALNRDSFAKALLSQGYVTGLSEADRAALLGQLGGPDPEMVNAFGRWAAPNTLPPAVRDYITRPRGFQTLGGGISPHQFLGLNYGVDPWAPGDSSPYSFMFGAPGGSEADTPGQQGQAADAAAAAQAAQDAQNVADASNGWG